MDTSAIASLSFLTMGVMTIIITILLLSKRWPVTAAMLMVVDFVLLAGMFGLLEAHFAAVAQIVVYAGAIMVVLLFVIMLLNLPPEELRYGRVSAFEWVLILGSIGVALLFGTTFGRQSIIASLAVSAQNAPQQLKPWFPLEENAKNVSSFMFTEYLWAFELTSFLILAAIVGVVVVAKKRKV